MFLWVGTRPVHVHCSPRMKVLNERMVRWTCVSSVKLTVVDVAWVTPFLLRAPKVAPHKQLIDGDEKGPMPHVELTATAAAWVPRKGKPRHVACCVKMFCFFLRLGLRGWWHCNSTIHLPEHISEMEAMIGLLEIVAGAWRVTKITTFHQDAARQCTYRPVTCDFPLALNVNFSGTGVTRCVLYEGKPRWSGVEDHWHHFQQPQLATNLPADTCLAWKEKSDSLCLHVLSDEWGVDHLIIWLHTWIYLVLTRCHQTFWFRLYSTCGVRLSFLKHRVLPYIFRWCFVGRVTGITLNMDWKEPLSSSEADRLAQRRVLANHFTLIWLIRH